MPLAKRRPSPSQLVSNHNLNPTSTRVHLHHIQLMEWSFFKIATAIICLTILELAALARGKNGTLMRIIIIAIAGLAGFSIAEFLK